MTAQPASFDVLLARLIASAKALAEASAANRSLAQSDPAARWRNPALLWPLFTKGIS